MTCLPGQIAGATGLTRPAASPVQFVVENANWSIQWDGRYITQGVNQIAPGLSAITTKPGGCANRLVHFGSHYMWLTWGQHLSRSNRFVATYFHGSRDDGPGASEVVDRMLESIDRLDTIVTAASIMEARLIGWGIPKDKIVRIPIGVDCNLFRRPTREERMAARARWGIADHQLCIGSFQKDGEGWSDGMLPKQIKGPDVFLDVIRELARDLPLFVLLTGPARGFVKKGLSAIGVPFAHTHVDDYREMPSFYHALDAYPVTSREEGGPKAVMESMASGVPVVSTRVGMAPDLIRHGVNGYLADVDDVNALVGGCLAACVNGHETGMIRDSARRDVEKYDWRFVADQHFEFVYEPILQRMGSLKAHYGTSVRH